VVSRVLAAFAALLMSFVAVTGIYGLWTTESMARDYLTASRFERRIFDDEQWSSHWRVSSFALSATGSLGVVAALGVILRRRWGAALLAAAAAYQAMHYHLLGWSGYAVYAFESPGRSDTLVFGITAIAFAIHFFVVRSPNPASAASAASVT
jgi:hypothetical protein